MSRKKNQNQKRKPSGRGNFHIEFKNDAQSLAWTAFQQHDVLFMTGAAGTGKTHLACAFAIQEVLNNNKKNIVLTRPIVESGESLGYLPGEFEDKVDPYMTPMWDCMDKLVGKGDNNPWRDKINDAIEVAPLAYMRGRSFGSSICIFDEAQNATMQQLKMFLSRFEEDSKIIITGDPVQSDLPGANVALVDVIHRLKNVSGIGFIQFKESQIVRHPLVGKIMEELR